MTRRLEVSEKTLELNLAAEILPRLRASPRLSRAYLIGMTQAQERLSGVDASLASDLVVVGAIQFKAPHAPTKRPEYRFTLPGRQLGCLQRLAPRLRGRVAYALPCVSRWDELRVTSPDVLSATIRLRVSGLSPGTHRVVVSSSTVTITSDPVVVPRVALVHEIDEWATEFESQPGEGATVVDVLGWLGELADMDREQFELRRSRQPALGQALRGLALVAVARPVPLDSANVASE
jgi:hypothetical protein